MLCIKLQCNSLIVRFLPSKITCSKPLPYNCIIDELAVGVFVTWTKYTFLQLLWYRSIIILHFSLRQFSSPFWNILLQNKVFGTLHVLKIKKGERTILFTVRAMSYTEVHWELKHEYLKAKVLLNRTSWRAFRPKRTPKKKNKKNKKNSQMYLRATLLVEVGTSVSVLFFNL